MPFGAVTSARRAQRVALVCASALTVTACTSTVVSQGPVSLGSTATSTAAPVATAAAVPPVTLAANVAAKQSVPVDTAVAVNASDGRLTKVTLKSKGRHEENPGAVPGTLDADKLTWKAKRLLDPGRTYVLTMSGVNAAGLVTTDKVTFKTKSLRRDQEAYPYSVPGDGGRVGVAMPVVMVFSRDVKNKAEFERRMVVTSVPDQGGTWRWLSSREAHFRPATFWKPGTKVSLKATLNGVAAGAGRYGEIDRTASFTVGRSVVSKVNLKTHKLTVYVNGDAVRTIPVSGGKKGFESRSGTKVIMEKWPERRMRSETVGIDAQDPEFYDVTVKYAMRETWSGEFLHSAPWSVGSQGRANVSHGCIGMSPANARWLFDLSLVGDPVIVTGSNRPLEEGNGWTDWNMSYKEFKKGSAL